MNDDTPSSPARKKLRQMSIMESISKPGMTQSNCVNVGTSSTDCTIDIEPEEDDITIAEQSVTTTTTYSSEIQSAYSTEKFWKGKPLTEMPSLFNQKFVQLCDIKPGRDHTVLFNASFLMSDALPEPHPTSYTDKWDAEHVKMPCSPSNLYPVNINGNSALEQRWKLVKQAFCDKKISCSLDLEKAILSYNSRYNNIWNFRGFHEFVDKELSSTERQKLFEHILPGIIRLAIEVPDRVTRTPVLLVRNKPHSISMSQSQIASLLANAFLNTYPRRNTQKRQLLENRSRSSWVYGKLRCLLNYFDRVVTEEPKGVVTFTRQVVSDSEYPNWDTASETLNGFHVSSEGTVEKEGSGLLQVDFANKFIGGGVLNTGCVQEEIRFVICPELIAACLFSEVMENNEALIITGCEQYSRHSGYGDTFRFEGDFVDNTPRDAYGRRLCQVVAIDAIPFRSKEVQYKQESIDRELRKAFAGFYCRHGVGLTAVATGNWGCGAFRGDPRLKCLIQLMAAAVTHRDVVYFTFGDRQLRDDLYNMYSLLKEKEVTVGALYTMLCQYGQQIGGSRSPSLDLYGYLYALLDTLDSEDGVADCSSETSLIESDVHVDVAVETNL